MKHYNYLLLGTLCSSIVLSGCSLYEKQGSDVPQIQTEAEKAAAAMELELIRAKQLFDEPAQKTAFAIFKKYADQGNTTAEAWLGRCFIKGIGTEVNHQKAFEYFSRAAAKNEPFALNGYGLCKENGWGTGKDLQEGLAAYKKASDLGLSLADINLGCNYGDPESPVFNKELSDSYFKKAIAAGEQVAVECYGKVLFEQQRYAEAVPYLQKSDSLLSTLILIECYKNGWGVDCDLRKAMELTDKAYAQQDKNDLIDSEIYFLGMIENRYLEEDAAYMNRCLTSGSLHGNADCLFLQGGLDIINENEANAIKHLKQSAEQGDFNSQMLLGDLLQDQKEYDEAIKYYNMAHLKKPNSIRAVEGISYCYLMKKEHLQANHWLIYGSGIGSDLCNIYRADRMLQIGGDENFAKAAGIFATHPESAEKFISLLENDYNRLRILADKGNSHALLALGALGTCLGETNLNFPIGLELLERSANSGNSEACRVLGDLYFQADKVKKDLKKALGWYRKGAELNNSLCAYLATEVMAADKANEYKTEEYVKLFEKCLEMEDFRFTKAYADYMKTKGKDPKKAEELYRLSAENGNTESMLILYDMLNKTDKKAALKYLEKAIEAENPKAIGIMGDNYLADKKYGQAYAAYLKAAYGDIDLAWKLADFWLNGYCRKADKGAFLRIAERAYKEGSPAVCLQLGDFYSNGKHTAKDLKKAREYYAEGAKRGNEACKKALEATK